MQMRPEEVVLLKKRQVTADKQTAQLESANLQKRKEGLKRLTIKGPAHFAKQYNKQVSEQHELVKAKKLIKGKLSSNTEKTSVLVVRIQSKYQTSAKINQLLHLLNLDNEYNAVFVRADAKVMQTLSLLNKYVCYGVLKQDTIRELLYKKAFCKINNTEIQITDNVIIEEQLGKCGILCFEDIVHEITNCTDKLQDINKFLACFKLNKPEEKDAKMGLVEKMDQHLKVLI